MFTFTHNNTTYTVDIGVYQTIKQYAGGREVEYGLVRTECVIYKITPEGREVYATGIEGGQGAKATRIAFADALINTGWSDGVIWDTAWDAFDRAREK